MEMFIFINLTFIMCNMKELIKKILKEETKEKFDYGCVMLYYDFPEMEDIHNIIDPKDIYHQEGDRSFGLEDEPHTTLLFGLHDDVTDEDVSKVLNKYKYSTCKLHNPSLFENPDYDVLKFDVKGDNLHKTNADLRRYPHTNSFPDYHPHTTIGYLKPGMGRKYVNKLKGMNYSLTPQYAVYSKPNGDKVRMDINL